MTSGASPQKNEGREHVPTFIFDVVGYQATNLTNTTRLTQGLAAVTRPLHQSNGVEGTVSRDPV